ncbi:MAG: GNAT family N-acetyltransferase [Salinivirgaceae bacterium]|nr:GNAT family N-acetyltransferase [Salinivirgaceae bacterium]
MELLIEKRPASVTEFQDLRSTTGWAMHSADVVEKALAKDLFTICISYQNQLIGVGRIIGDGAMYFYIQDIIVRPEFKGKGIGKIIMNAIEKYLNTHTYKNSFIGLMAADGVKEFYKKFGYSERDENKPGMFKVITTDYKNQV